MCRDLKKHYEHAEINSLCPAIISAMATALLSWAMVILDAVSLWYSDQHCSLGHGNV